MNDIGPVNPLSSTSHVPADSHRLKSAGTVNSNPRAPKEGDRVELSEHARLLNRALELPAVRVDLVQSVRSELAAGSYETAEKLETAAEALLHDLELYS